LTPLSGLSSGSGVAGGLMATVDADGTAESDADADADASGETDGLAWSSWLDCAVGMAAWVDPALPFPQPMTATPTSSAVAASLVVRLT
jgi:hypothetical protein